MLAPMLECVVNVSEGVDQSVLRQIIAAAGDDLLDLHTDPHHNRSVFTLVGEIAPRKVASAAVELIDINSHVGVHPRIGAVDVVPFVPLGSSRLAEAHEARDDFCEWVASHLGVPCFKYGNERTLPDIRREAFTSLQPDVGPGEPHPTAGAMAVGAREVLVAYNVWLVEADIELARQIAASVRGPNLRALGLRVGEKVQVSMNLTAPAELGPLEATDAVAGLAAVEGCELVGLIPKVVLDATPKERWTELDLDPARTIEMRLQDRLY